MPLHPEYPTHSKKTASRLKEVWTQDCGSARSIANSETTNSSHLDAKSAATADIGICQYEEVAVPQMFSLFTTQDECMFDVIANSLMP